MKTYASQKKNLPGTMTMVIYLFWIAVLCFLCCFVSKAQADTKWHQEPFLFRITEQNEFLYNSSIQPLKPDHNLKQIFLLYQTIDQFRMEQFEIELDECYEEQIELEAWMIKDVPNTSNTPNTTIFNHQVINLDVLTEVVEEEELKIEDWMIKSIYFGPVAEGNK